MKIYLFRHAQKAMDFSGDPDLTIEGHAQASKVLDKVIKNELPTPTHLWVSPKRRTFSTFKPLSQHLNIPVEVYENLLEQKGEESLADFRLRIEKTLAISANNPQQVLFICTHYDWVAEAMSVIPCDTDLSGADFAHWNPCQHIGFEVTADGLFQLIELKRIHL